MVMEEGGLKPQGSCSLLGVSSVFKIGLSRVLWAIYSQKRHTTSHRPRSSSRDLYSS